MRDVLEKAQEGEEPQGRQAAFPRVKRQAVSWEDWETGPTWRLESVEDLHSCCKEATGKEETGNNGLIMNGEVSAEVGQGDFSVGLFVSLS